MAEATLNTPQTADPRQFSKVRLLSATMLFSNKALQLTVGFYDANGNEVGRKTANVATQASQTYVGNQEAAILQKALAALGLAGTIA